MTTKESILNFDDQVSEKVNEWGQDLEIRTMSGVERDSYELEMTRDPEGQKNRNFRARLVARCLFDPTAGARVFTDEEAEQLGTKSGAKLDRLFDIAARINRIGKKYVEADAKNS